MSTLHELEIRVLRVERRWDESDQEFHDAMNEIARFQRRITRMTAIVAGVAGAVAMLFVIRHWLVLDGFWPQSFSIAMGILAYAVIAAWLDRWRVQERDVLRRRYYGASPKAGVAAEGEATD